MSSALLISCDAFASLFVAPHRAARQAQLRPADHDPRAVATCKHPSFVVAPAADGGWSVTRPTNREDAA